MWQQWINFIVGLWVILSAYLGFTPATMATNLTISGIIVAVLALWGALKHNSNHSTMTTEERFHSHA